MEERRRQVFDTHRDSVIWYLGRELEEVAEVQRGMMERRLEREVERGRSVLYKVKGNIGAVDNDIGSSGGGEGGMNGHVGAGGDSNSREKKAREVALEDESRRNIEQQLTPEQLQLFAKENQDMLKHYEDTLDQVRYIIAFFFLPPPLFSLVVLLPKAHSLLLYQNSRAFHARNIRTSNYAGTKPRHSKRQYITTGC